MFNCLCTEKDSHSKCEKLERFVSVTGVVWCCVVARLMLPVVVAMYEVGPIVQLGR